MRKLVAPLLIAAALTAGCMDADIAAQIPVFTFVEDGCDPETVALIEAEGLDVTDVELKALEAQTEENHDPDEASELLEQVMACMKET